MSDNNIIKTIDILEVEPIIDLLSRGSKIEDASILTGEATYKMEMLAEDGKIIEIVELYDVNTDMQYVKYVNANTYYYVLVDTILSNIIVVDEVG